MMENERTVSGLSLERRAMMLHLQADTLLPILIPVYPIVATLHQGSCLAIELNPMPDSRTHSR
jgi:hypothetical protein